jgi:NADH-quinone oxidoreductase subunit C
MSELTNAIVLEKLVTKFGAGILSHDEPYGMLTIVAEKNINVKMLKFLFDDEQLKFQFMTDLCGIHYPDQALELGVIYHLHSLENNVRIRLKFFVSKENPTIATATSVYATANWQERETFDFFGIIFEGHPDLRRILNVDEMEAFPLRKEFPLEDPNRTDKKDYFFGR